MLQQYKNIIINIDRFMLILVLITVETTSLTPNTRFSSSARIPSYLPD
jgi:hypothetical protein